jgi:hypothetical protein
MSKHLSFSSFSQFIVRVRFSETPLGGNRVSVDRIAPNTARALRRQEQYEYRVIPQMLVRVKRTTQSRARRDEVRTNVAESSCGVV